MRARLLTITAAALVTFWFAGIASAATASGTLTVSGLIEDAMTLTITSAGGSFTGANTSSAATSLGNVSRHGSAPAGFTISRDASSWTLASSIGIKVVGSNGSSANYTLGAQLASAPASGITWKLATLTMNATSAVTLTSTGTYNTTETLLWTIAVSNTASGTVNNTLTFTAVAN